MMNGVEHDAQTPRHIAGESIAVLAAVTAPPNRREDVVYQVTLLRPMVITVKMAEAKGNGRPAPLIMFLLFDRKDNVRHGGASIRVS